MKTLIEISVLKDSFYEILSQYEDIGFDYISSSDMNSETLKVILRGDVHSLPHVHSDKSYLEFDDGTQSPLYIKRNRDFWED